MTATKNNSIFKKLGALAMAMCLTCALAVSAGAASNSYSVTINKSGSSDISMANDIVAGNATVTTVANGIQIDIPIKPIEDYKAMPFLPAADGYLQTVEVPEAVSAEVVKDGVMYEEARGCTPFSKTKKRRSLISKTPAPEYYMIGSWL